MHLLTLPMLLLALAQEPNDAEKLFRAAEKKLLEADTVQFTMDGVPTGGEGLKLKTTFLATKGNKSSANVTAIFGDEQDGKSWRIQTVSNGVKTRSTVLDCGLELNNRSVYDTPKNLNAAVIVLMFRAGILGAYASVGLGSPPDNRQIEIDKSLIVSEFAMGKKEKIGDRLAQRIDYVVSGNDAGPDKVSYKTQIWLDTTTGLPVKRATSIPWDDKKIELTETYDIRINAKIDAKVFELPK